MAYRSQVNLREKGGAIAVVVATHIVLLIALLNLPGKTHVRGDQPALRLVDLPQPRPTAKPRPHKQPRRRLKKGGAAPRAIKSEASPIVAPTPKVQPPPVQQIATSETPRQGAAPTQGSSPERGSGTGAGGSGSGTGNGTGAGAGGMDVAEPPRLASPVLSGRDFPRDLLHQWPRRATVFLRLRIDPRGDVAECMIDRGTGVADIDNAICTLAHERLRFLPALNRNGQAVAGWFGYAQPAPR